MPYKVNGLNPIFKMKAAFRGNESIFISRRIKSPVLKVGKAPPDSKTGTQTIRFCRNQMIPVSSKKAGMSSGHSNYLLKPQTHAYSNTVAW